MLAENEHEHGRAIWLRWRVKERYTVRKIAFLAKNLAAERSETMPMKTIDVTNDLRLPECKLTRRKWLWAWGEEQKTISALGEKGVPEWSGRAGFRQGGTPMWVWETSAPFENGNG
jgi:hypothetical protein